MWYNILRGESMKKLIIMVCLSMALVGCRRTVNIDEDRKQKYESYITAIEDSENKLTSSSNFDITLAVNRLSETEYRYDVIIDNPKIAMYGIEVLVVERNVVGTINEDKLMPSVGIFESNTYNMLPNQHDIDKGFPKGITVGGTTEQSEITVYVLVVWTEQNQQAQKREIFVVQGKYDPDAKTEVES